VTESHAHPREQLADTEGLAEIVIGAGVERRDLVGLLAARGEDDDRHRAPLAKPRDHLQSVDVRQAEVDDDDIRLPARGLDEPFLAVPASKTR